MLESGAIQKITDQWSKSMVEGDCKDGSGLLEAVAIESAASPFLILAFGLGASGIIFLFERVFFRR